MMKIRFYSRYKKGTKDEHLVFKVEDDCNLHEYIIYDSTFDGHGELSNLLPHMYRFPFRHVTKGSYVILYIHDFGSRRDYEMDEDGGIRYRFAWGLSSNVGVFNKEKDFIHIAKIEETRVSIVEG